MTMTAHQVHAQTGGRDDAGNAHVASSNAITATATTTNHVAPPLGDPARKALEDDAQRVLSTRARSFRWGQYFLPDTTAKDVAICYAFCRMVDDTVDDASMFTVAGEDRLSAKSKDQAQKMLNQIEAEVRGTRAPRPLIAAYLEVCRRRGIFESAACELIEGMRSDLGVVRVQNDNELMRYAYRAAGTVGVMMHGLLDVDDRDVIPNAIDLGIAMQLTNIARDVFEDAQMGRVYLPASRLRAHGVSSETVLDGTAKSSAVFAVVKEILDVAEAFYRSADVAMAAIPWRARGSILVAARLYRSIGLAILRRGELAVTSRTVVSPVEKAVRALWAMGEWILSPFLRRAPAQHQKALHRDLIGLPGTNHG